MSRRGVFLDLNGTLVEPLKQERLDELTLIPGVAEAVARLTAAGFVCPVVTVQSRIAKGLFSMADFQTWFATFAADLEALGALVVGPYVCPHRYGEPCPCKKPSVLLYERAASEHHLTTTDCFVIGDSPDDVRAARRLGARGCLVHTGWASDPGVVETIGDAPARQFGRWAGTFPAGAFSIQPLEGSRFGTGLRSRRGGEPPEIS